MAKESVQLPLQYGKASIHVTFKRDESIHCVYGTFSVAHKLPVADNIYILYLLQL